MPKLGVWSAVLFLTWAVPLAGAESWQAGTARLKITPGKPIWMAGFAARNHPAEGTLHDLWAKVLVLEDRHGQRAALITSDVCGFSKAAYETIVAELGKQCRLERSQIMLTYSHTHTGPALRECLQDYYPMNEQQRADVEQYSRELETKLVAAVANAFSQMRPATLWAGEGTTGFAVNRRNNREAEVPKLLAEGTPLKGPVDHQVPVLAVGEPGKDLRAVLFGYACHTSSLAIYQWSGDYAGFAQIELEKSRPGAQAMFFQACGGDQGAAPRRTVELCEKYGRMLAQAVDETLKKPMRPLAARLQTAFEFVDLPFERSLTAEELNEYVRKGGLYGRWAQRMLQQMAEGKAMAKSHPYAVLVWKLGDQLWISLAGEPVVDYGLALKARFGPRTWANGFAHDLTAYIPSTRVWNEGGYEGGALGEYGLPAMRWAPDVEQRILKCVERLVAKMK